MPQPYATVVRRVGRTDAAVFILVWSLLTLFLASRPAGALPAIAFGVVPLSALVGWRGAASAKRFLADTATLRQSLLEGSGIAATLMLALLLWGWLAPMALAAGHPLDGLAPTQLAFWFSLGTLAAVPASLAASIGAAHGLVLHFLNQWLVLKWSAK